MSDMFLEKLELLYFKNFDRLSIVPTKKVNLLYGPNGSGKTNLLDAIHFVCITKSYFGLADRELINAGNDFYRLDGKLRTSHSNSDSVTIKFKEGQRKQVLCNDLIQKNAAEIIGRFPVVLIAPDDIRIVKDDSRHRRSFVDKILSQANNNYLTWILEYNRALKQKSAHLKRTSEPSTTILEGFNQILLRNGKLIRDERFTFANEFTPRVRSIYADLSEQAEEVDLIYQTQLDADLNAQFSDYLPREVAARRVLFGIHKDDFEFVIGGTSLKRFGSQGQIKSFLYALRLSEFEYLGKQTSTVPILLLDDLFEKLDSKRLEKLMEAINNDNFDQVFMSDTELNRSKSIFNKYGISFTAYEIIGGKISQTTDY